MKHYILSILSLLFSFFVHAQNLFITKGKIEFEKKVNMYKNLDDRADDGDRTWILTMKKSMPEYYTTYFDLYFDEYKTLYKPGKEVVTTQKTPDWFIGPAGDNVVFNDLEIHKTIAQKNVFESTFLIDDTSRKIEWRITNDTRDIAGFECRKAVGRIMDSVYVIAFYTDLIVCSGGPESFNGLPGVILGIAIPRIHATWFATKVELVQVTPETLAAPKKGKKITNTQLMEQLKTATKDWGKSAQQNMWKAML